MFHVCLWKGCVVTSSVRGRSCRPLVHRSPLKSPEIRPGSQRALQISWHGNQNYLGGKSFNTSVVFALVSCTSTLETDYSTALFSKKREYLFRLIRPMGSPTFPVISQRVGRFPSPLPSFPSPPVSKPQRGLPEPRPVCDQCNVR